MNSGQLYQHLNNTDVAAEVLKCFYIKEREAYSVRIRWWNVGKAHAPWCMNLEERFIISKEAAKSWIPFSLEPMLK